MDHRRGLIRFGFHLTVGLTLASVALADYLFYDSVMGWTLGGFVAWLSVLIAVRYRRRLYAGPRRGWGWSLTVLMLGLCVSLVIEPGLLAGLLAAMAMGSMALLGRSGGRDRLLGWGWLARLCGLWCVALVRPIRDTWVVNRWRRRASVLRSRAMAYAGLVWSVVGIVVPGLLALMFIGLFAIANPVVSDWVGTASDRAGDFLANLTDYITFGRLLLWYLAAVACWGVLRYRPGKTTRDHPATPGFVHPVQAAAERKRETAGDDGESPQGQIDTPPDHAKQSPDMGAWITRKYQTLIARCLVVMNLVFAVQLVLDSRYLVFGDALPDGMTYAEYAHRGAYPLVFTVLLAAAMVLAVFRPGGVARQSVWVYRLVVIWILQNVALMVSAAIRLSAYVEAYSLTRLRVAAAVWMVLVAGVLLLLIWRITSERDNAWLTRISMGWAFCILWVCAFVPFDPIIAHYNVAHCRELGGSAGPIDVGYLEHLGPDALPAIDLLIEKLPPQAADAPPGVAGDSWGGSAEVSAVRYRASDQASEPTQTLGERLAQARSALSSRLDEQLEDWRGWTARRAWLSEQAME